MSEAQTRRSSNRRIMMLGQSPTLLLDPSGIGVMECHIDECHADFITVA
jgi:hypothetical protein